MYSARVKLPCSNCLKAATSAFDFGFVQSLKFFNNTSEPHLSILVSFIDLMHVLPPLLASIAAHNVPLLS